MLICVCVCVFMFVVFNSLSNFCWFVLSDVLSQWFYCYLATKPFTYTITVQTNQFRRYSRVTNSFRRPQKQCNTTDCSEHCFPTLRRYYAEQAHIGVKAGENAANRKIRHCGGLKQTAHDAPHFQKQSFTTKPKNNLCAQAEDSMRDRY